MVMYQPAQLSTPSSSQASQQHHVIVQQNITPPHQQQSMNQQTIHQSQPIVITPPQQNVVRQPYTVYSQPHKRVYHHTTVPQQSVQMRTVPIVEQQQRILQMGPSIQKTVPRLVAPSHVSTVQSSPMPRIRATRPRPTTTIQQSPRIVTQSVRPRQLSPGMPGIIRHANIGQQTQRIVQNIRPQQNQYRPQGQQQQPRFTAPQAPALQRMSVSARMTSPNSTNLAVAKKAIATPQQKIQTNNIAKPQFVTETKSSSTSTVDINELDDLENSITAAKIHKTPPEPPPAVSTQNVAPGPTQYIVQSQQSNIQLCQKPNYVNQRPTNQNTQTLQQPYLHNPSLDDSRKVVTLRNGEIMPLTEYKRKIQDNQYLLPQQQQQPQQQQLQQSPTQPVIIRGNSTRGRGSNRGTGQMRGSYVKKQFRQPAHQQLQQQISQDQSHIIETEVARESAKMLVVLQSGEQRLITFTLPKESCTVQELLEQVGVPFTDHTNIECVTNPGVSIANLQITYPYDLSQFHDRFIFVIIDRFCIELENIH